MVRFGIIGCGSIAHTMADALKKCANTELVAVAARDSARAEAFAAKFGAARAYGSYEQLANDSDLDAVYVATIHPTHADAVKMCLNAGKPVLCEKPLAMSRAEAEELFALARERNLLLMEALWTRCLPAWRKAKEWIDTGAIGRVKTAYTNFSIRMKFDPESRLFNMAKGGGGLLDLGVYPLHCAVYAMGNEVVEAQAMGRLAESGADCHATVILRFAHGGVAIATCGSDACGSPSEGYILGETGSIVIPSMQAPSNCFLRRPGQPDEVFTGGFDNGFTFEVEEFCRALSAGEIESPLVPAADTLTVAGIIDKAIAQINAQ